MSQRVKTSARGFVLPRSSSPENGHFRKNSLIFKRQQGSVKKYTHLILHVGTNDIGNRLCSKLITQYYCNLLELITHNFLDTIT
jgi:hypothetical protein